MKAIDSSVECYFKYFIRLGSLASEVFLAISDSINQKQYRYINYTLIL